MRRTYTRCNATSTNYSPFRGAQICCVYFHVLCVTGVNTKFYVLVAKVDRSALAKFVDDDRAERPRTKGACTEETYKCFVRFNLRGKYIVRLGGESYTCFGYPEGGEVHCSI